MESRILISTHFSEVCARFSSVVVHLTFVGKDWGGGGIEPEDAHGAFAIFVILSFKGY